MRIYSTQSALRLVAAILFTLLVASCGQGDGPEPILDTGRDPGAAARQEGFEDASAISFNSFEGAVAQIINNPQKLAARGGFAAKPNLSDKVGEMKIGNRFTNFGGAVLTLPEKFGYADGEVIKIDVWASREVTLRFILSGPGAIEKDVTHPGNSQWEELAFDFTGQNPPKTNEVVLIFDPGVAVSGGDVQANTFYFDNIFGGTDAETSVIGGAGDGGGGGPATGGAVPEVVVIAADGSAPDLASGVDFTEFTVFGSGAVFNTSFTGDSSYGNAVEVTIGAGYGGGAMAQFAATGFPAGFAESYDEFLFKVKGLTADNTVLVKIEPAASTTVTVDLSVASGSGYTVEDLGDGWSQVVVQVSEFGDVSGSNQFIFQTLDGAYAEGDKFYLTDIGFNNGAGGPGGNLATNGDFETGNLDGWTPAAGSGTIEAVDTQDSGSTWSGRLSTPMGNGAALSQANLAAGTVAMGDLIDVSFDLCGITQGDSGEVAIALLSEFGMGAGADRQDLQRFNQTNLPSVWTRYNLQGIAGSNVTGGVSLQFDAICGAVAGCGVELFVDNVVVTIGGGIVAGTASGQSCDTGGGGGGGTPVSGAVFDDAVDSQWTESLLAFDQAIGFGECVDDGGAGCPSINWSVVAAADMARGDVVDVVYDGSTNFAGLVIGRTSAGLDFSQFAGGNVVFDLNVTSNPNGVPFLMKVDCVGCPTDAGQREQSLGVPAAGWQTFTIPVDDMVNANGGPTQGGLKLDQVTTGIVVFPGFGAARQDVTYQIDNIRWEAPPSPGAVFDDAVDSQWTESLLAFDQAIGFGECVDDGGAGCPSINWSVVAAADMARGDVVDVVYDGSTNFAGLVIGRTSAGLDFSQFAGGNVVFDLNVTSNPNGVPFLMKVDCVGCPTDAGQREQSLGVPAAGWQTFTIPVDDMVNANGGPTQGGLKLDQVTTGIVVFPGFGAARQDVTYQIDNIRWETGGGGGGGGGSAMGILNTNGDFETGDFTGVETFPNTGTVTISSVNPRSGTFSAELDVPNPGGDALIKFANLSPGGFTAGQTIHIKFYMRGSVTTGGVGFAEFFSELSGGGVSKAEILFGNAPVFPNADPNVWTLFETTTTTGSDTSGGVTLQLKAGSGGGSANLFFDDVCVSTEPCP